jgi:hypothetical protein
MRRFFSKGVNTVLAECTNPAQSRQRETKRYKEATGLTLLWRRGIAAPIKDFSNPPLYNPAFGTNHAFPGPIKGFTRFYSIISNTPWAGIFGRKKSRRRALPTTGFQRTCTATGSRTAPWVTEPRPIPRATINPGGSILGEHYIRSFRGEGIVQVQHLFLHINWV